MHTRNSWTQKHITRRTLIKGGSAAGLVLAGLPAAACHQAGKGTGATSPPSASGTPKAGGTLSVSQIGNPPTLDPQSATSEQTMELAGAVMSRLFRYKLGAPNVSSNHDLQNDLAISAESPDAVTWTVKLRPGTKFQNVAPVSGHAVEAEDVKASFTRALTYPRNPNRGSLTMMDAQQIETPASDTVVFKLKYPFALFTNTLAAPKYSWIFPREVASGAYDPAKQMIGSGPFLLDSYTPDVAITFKKNPDWFEKGQPHIDGVRLAIIPDPAQALGQLAAGHLDALARIQENDLDAAKKDNPKAAVIAATSGGGNAYYFNLGIADSPFRDPRLRQAISMSIDRDAIGKAVYGKQYDIAFHVRLYLGKWALHLNQLDPSVQQYYKLNLDAAKKLFNETGDSNLSVRIVYTTGYVGTADQKPMTEAIANMLQALPWKITLSTIDYLKDLSGNGKGLAYGNIPADMILGGGISAYSNVDEYLFNYFDSKSTRPQENLNDPKLDSMIDKARATLDESARVNAYIDVQKYIAGQVYAIEGLPAGNYYTLVQPWVQNYTYSFEDGNLGEVWAGLWLNK